MFILLDTGPLGTLTNPNLTRKTREIRDWMRSHLLDGVGFLLPEIADYELRRNLILENLTAAIGILDGFKHRMVYLPLTTETMQKAAEMWADVRRQGLPTAPEEALDGDVILAAQAHIASAGTEEIVIATINVGHLARFDTATVTAREWSDIIPTSPPSP